MKCKDFETTVNRAHCDTCGGRLVGVRDRSRKWGVFCVNGCNGTGGHRSKEAALDAYAEKVAPL